MNGKSDRTGMGKARVEHAPITTFKIRLKCSSMRCCYYDKNLRC